MTEIFTALVGGWSPSVASASAIQGTFGLLLRLGPGVVVFVQHGLPAVPVREAPDDGLGAHVQAPGADVTHVVVRVRRQRALRDVRPGDGGQHGGAVVVAFEDDPAVLTCVVLVGVGLLADVTQPVFGGAHPSPSRQLTMTRATSKRP